MAGTPEAGPVATPDDVGRLERWLEESRAWADAALASFADATPLGPPALEEAVRYALLGGGKRIRPALVRMVAGAHGGDAADVAACAVAVECVHTYSLV
ncbi:MAG: polyprenyl synthetase family protein, partial [Planctomycetota bacterium]